MNEDEENEQFISIGVPHAVERRFESIYPYFIVEYKGLNEDGLFDVNLTVEGFNNDEEIDALAVVLSSLLDNL